MGIIAMNVNDTLNKHIHNIMDVFGGGDNGKFWNFKLTVEALDKQCQEGDVNAGIILDKIIKFSKCSCSFNWKNRCFVIISYRFESVRELNKH